MSDMKTGQEQGKFGRWLRENRDALDLTQPSLAELVGVTKQHISNLERGEKCAATGKFIKPCIELMARMAAVFNVSLLEIMNKAEMGAGDIPAQPLTPHPAIDGVLPIGQLETPAGVGQVILSICEKLPEALQLEVLRFAISLYQREIEPGYSNGNSGDVTACPQKRRETA